jgi:hypothetical protein
LFEVGISMVMYAQVGLLVHALSLLNFDGLYIKLVIWSEIQPIIPFEIYIHDIKVAPLFSDNIFPIS